MRGTETTRHTKQVIKHKRSLRRSTDNYRGGESRGRNRKYEPESEAMRKVVEGERRQRNVQVRLETKATKVCCDACKDVLMCNGYRKD
jgi:hypothetical protein